MNDRHYMEIALELAARGKGYTSPNPMVGAVVVKNGQIVGKGWHEKVGGPHAEVNAIDDAGELAAGSTIYVTLEPCVMCMGAMILARIPRLVYACRDPRAGAVGSIYDFAQDDRFNHKVESLILESEGTAPNAVMSGALVTAVVDQVQCGSFTVGALCRPAAVRGAY